MERSVEGTTGFEHFVANIQELPRDGSNDDHLLTIEFQLTLDIRRQRLLILLSST